MYTTMNVISHSRGKQTHVHEFLGSTDLSEKGNHRKAISSVVLIQ